MTLKKWMDSIITRLDGLDLMLIKLSSVALGLLLAKLIPSLTTVGTGWLVLAMLLPGLRPMMKVWSK